MKKTAHIQRFRKKLTTFKTVAIDSMVFSYYFHDTEPYSALSDIIFDLIDNQQLQVKTSVISYLESLSYSELAEDIDKASFIKSFFLSQPALAVAELTINIADRAAKLRREYRLSTPDAIQYSTALAFETEAFITNDEHFKNVVKKENLPIIFLDNFIRYNNLRRSVNEVHHLKV